MGGPNGLFLRLRKDSKTVPGSTHVVEQLSVFMFPSILTFDFGLILGSFLTFWGPNGLFLGLEKGLATVLTFDFDLILGSILTFWGPNGLFWGSGFGLVCFGV